MVSLLATRGATSVVDSATSSDGFTGGMTTMVTSWAAAFSSMHSISKGLSGECGLRGGYFEVHNLDMFA